MKSVIKGTSYILVHAPDMVIHDGTTQSTERIVNPDSEYLKQIKDHIRNYEEVVNYLPNQAYIGNLNPLELDKYEQPWFKQEYKGQRYGHFGEIMPQAEFYFLMQAVDEFELVRLEEKFVEQYKSEFEKNEIITDFIKSKVHDGVAKAELDNIMENGGAGLYMQGELVGAVKQAHQIDVNLSSHVMLENIVSKASSVLSLLYAVKNSGIDKDEVEYVIDCCEEACGDMNQRGGGNFAKAAAEIAELKNATGSDTRGFCAAPVHALVLAASLVQAGTYKTVIVTAGGSTAKLGMNGKDHIKKDMPILEDVIGGFAIVISQNDGKNPEIDLSHLGRHMVGTGSSPQNVIQSLVTDPLDSAELKVTDVDKYSPEMQNPDITKPAGAGDVPVANLKMIAALAVKRGDLARADLANFVKEHGVPGFAPTQGHIPSGVPYLGYGREEILSGNMKRLMIVGKGSLFLGRMTNLFDGVSFMVVPNSGQEEESSVSKDEVRLLIAESLRDFAKTLISE